MLSILPLISKSPNLFPKSFGVVPTTSTTTGITVIFMFHIIIIIYSLKFFISVLADGFSLEFEWQQVSSSLQDTSQNSSRSQ